MNDAIDNQLVPLEPNGLEAGRFAAAPRGNRTLDTLMEIPRRRAYALVAITFAITFALDIVTPVEMSFSLLYLLPVALAAWTIDRRACLVVATSASLAIYGWERFGAYPYTSVFFLYWAFLVHAGFYAAFGWALAALRATYLRTKSDSLRDAETALYNRRGFYEAVAVETRRAIRFSRSLSLATFEVGDAFSPEELRKLATALSSSRQYDVPARIDRGRFVLLLPETGAEAARIAVDRVRREAGFEVVVEGRVGIATFEWPPTCVDDLLREADRVMVAARKLPAPCLRHAVLRGASVTPVPLARLSQS